MSEALSVLIEIGVSMYMFFFPFFNLRQKYQFSGLKNNWSEESLMTITPSVMFFPPTHYPSIPTPPQEWWARRKLDWFFFFFLQYVQAAVRGAPVISAPCVLLCGMKWPISLSQWLTCGTTCTACSSVKRLHLYVVTSRTFLTLERRFTSPHSFRGWGHTEVESYE